MILKYIIFAITLHVYVPGQVSALVDPVDVICTVNGLVASFSEEDLKKIHYLLWTRTNPGNGEQYTLLPFDSASLESSPFDGTKKTYMLIHGFGDVGTKQWILDAKTKILNIEDANVFSLDHGELVKNTTLLHYIPSICNAYKVGNYTAYVLNWLHKETGLAGSSIHLIGHSLGAHVAGVIGHYLKHDPKLTTIIVGRITGLDPAGPFYSEVFLNDFRLDKEQADYVDIIHTNGCLNSLECRGIGEKISHVDFKPNGGVHQPGCDSIDTSCSHERVTDLYVESIKPITITFKSWPCGSWDDFKEGSCTSCGDGCLDMGLHVETDLQPLLFYYLRTNSQSPYAKGDSQEE